MTLAMQRCSLALLTIAALGLSARAQTAVRLAPEPLRSDSLGMAYDPVRQRLVTFCRGALATPGTMHERVGATWQQIGTTPIGLAAVVADPSRQLIVGLVRSSFNAPSLQTHLWDGSTWTQVPGNLPIPLGGLGVPALAFHPGTGQIVAHQIFHTHTWDGTSWQPVAVGSAPVANSASMTTDAARDRCVMFGHTGMNWQTTEWDGTAWSVVATANVPPPNHPPKLSYDPIRQRTVMLTYPAGPNNEVWEYDGLDWALMSPATSPPGRFDAALGFDWNRGRLVMHGGEIYANGLEDVRRQDEWEWDGSAWQQVYSGPQGTSYNLVFRDPARSQPVMTQTGYSNPLGYSNYVWTGSGWRSIGPSSMASGSYLAWTDPSANATYAYDPFHRSMWRWMGSDWQNVTAGLQPPERSWPGLAYDSSRGVLVMFGGTSYNPLGDTWEWDGVNWTERTPTNTPTARRGSGMGFDPVSGKVILFGGNIAGINGLQNDTWSWDGVDWQQLPQVNPPARRSGTMMTTGIDGRLTIFAGNGVSGSLSDVHVFDGQSWAPAGSLPQDFEYGLQAVTLEDAVLIRGTETTWAWTNSVASVASYGGGCGAPAPRLAAAGRPSLGAPEFSMVVDRMQPGSVAVLVFGIAPTTVTLSSGCDLLVKAPTVFGFRFATAQGQSQFALPIPAWAGLLGLDLRWQAASFAGNGLTASDGLRLIVGY